MARELVVIPKMKYEQLLKAKERDGTPQEKDEIIKESYDVTVGKKKDMHKEEDMNPGSSMTNDKHEKGKLHVKTVDVVVGKKKDLRKEDDMNPKSSMINNKNEKGKLYVKMKPARFQKRIQSNKISSRGLQRKHDTTTTRKWLPFPI